MQNNASDEGLLVLLKSQEPLVAKFFLAPPSALSAWVRGARRSLPCADRSDLIDLLLRACLRAGEVSEEILPTRIHIARESLHGLPLGSRAALLPFFCRPAEYFASAGIPLIEMGSSLHGIESRRILWRIPEAMAARAEAILLADHLSEPKNDRKRSSASL